MNQKTIMLGPGQTLVVEWDKNWSNLSVRNNGVLIGRVADKVELKGGRDFLLPDGGVIKVLVSDYGLELWHNGVELVSGTKSGEKDHFGSAFKALISVGTLQLVFAVLSLFSLNTFGLFSAVIIATIGGILIGLGLWARDSGNKSPFWIGIVLCLINIVFSLLAVSIVGLLITGVLLYYLYRGTQSVPPQPTRKKSLDMNAPLDSDL